MVERVVGRIIPIESQFPVEGPFFVMATPVKSFKELVAAGDYPWVNPRTSEDSFPLEWQFEGEVGLYLLRFKGGNVSFGDVIRTMDYRGYSPAGVAELLLFGGKYKDKQRTTNIVELAQISTGPGSDGYTHQNVMLLGYTNRERDLNIGWAEMEFDPRNSFLARKKYKRRFSNLRQNCRLELLFN